MRDHLPPGRRPGRARWAALLTGALVLAVLGATPSAVPEAVAATAATPVVWDPRPAPGSVVDGTSVVLAARVPDRGEQPVTFLVDGQRVRGPRVDPDGRLSDLAGIEVTLAPGPREIAVSVGVHGVVRRWSVVVAGMSVQTATEDARRLLGRLAPATADTVDRPVVLLDLDRPDLALSVPALARALGAAVVPLRPANLTPRVLQTLEETSGEVIVLGERSADPAFLTALAAGGRPVTTLPGVTTAQVSASALQLVHARSGTTSGVDAAEGAPGGAGTRPLVVGPSVPFDAALTGAAAAARLDADLLLLDPPLEDVPASPPAPPTGSAPTPLPVDVGPMPDQRTRDAVAAADTVLLSAGLAPGSRAAVIAALGEGAVASDDALVPVGAAEAVVLPDDLDRGRAVVAAAADSADRPVLVGSARAIGWIGANRPDRVTVVAGERPAGPWLLSTDLPAFALAVALDGEEPAVAPPVPLLPDASLTADTLGDPLRRAWVDGPSPAAVEVTVDDAPGVEVSAGTTIREASVHVTLLGYEWPGTMTTDGGTVTWRADARPPLPLPLEPAVDGTPLPLEVTTSITTTTGTVHRQVRTTTPVDPVDTISPEGWLVAGGSDAPVGSGRLYTYSVEVEPETGLDLVAVEAEVSRILTDPRSWTADGGVTFQRVGRSQAARVRVVIARPATVDAMCGAVGLRTGGRVSCWDGYRAMLNLDRWATGVVPFHSDLTVYRQYLVNHEVGHGLGHRHEFCPRAGAVAPVMMQQTGGLGACRANGWPFP